MISENKISEVINKIASNYNPEKIILFGSYAIGKQTEDSDLDLLIIKESDLSRPQRSILIRKMLFGTNIPLDLIVYTPSEITRDLSQPNSFINNVFSSGKIVYERQKS